MLIPNILADTSDIIKPLIKNVDHPLLNKCDTLIIHNVKKKETLYSISKKYNLSIDKIISNNLFLEDEGLLKDQNLKNFMILILLSVQVKNTWQLLFHLV